MRKTRRELTPAAQAAKAIRTELKVAYPHTTFRVKSRNFSGGDAVDVEWTDGPTTEMVDKLIAQYEYGHFDGMDDMYHYSNCREDIPQAKYVHTRRDYSRETFTSAVETINRWMGWLMQVDPVYTSVTQATDFHTGCGWQSQEVHRYLHRTSLICRECNTPRNLSDVYCAECGAKVEADRLFS